MDLVAAIVDYAANGTDANALALQALLPSGNLVNDYDWQGKLVPYCVVSETAYDLESEGANKSFRIDRQFVQFEVYANQRSQVVAILDAIEHAYLNTILQTDNPCLAPGYKDDRLIRWAIDHFIGSLNLSFLLQRSPE